MLKFHKSGDLALDFTFKDITGVFAMKANEGMLTLLLNKKQADENTPASANNAGSQAMKPQLLQRNVILGCSQMSGLHAPSNVP
jgi:hypothetical protein